MKRIIEFKAAEDKTPLLPEAIEFKDEVYASLLSDLYDFYTAAIKKNENQYIENNEFMTAWIHEIKTPITTLKLLMDTLQLDEDNTVISIKEEVDKIDDYVEKVLYYSRSDEFSKDYIISEVSLNKLVKESVKKHSTIFIKKRISFIDEMDKNLFIDTDKKWLLFIIDQILSNSLKYTDHNGFIKVSSKKNDKEIILSIEDNGKGIKKEDIDRVFTKAFTGNNGRNINSKATGLGLYLSQKMAKKLNHYLTITSEYDKGTTVYIHFPKWLDYYITKM
jgi:Signal transduction histidine kinase